ncbi:MAG: AAA family ATPase [Pseudomonadota bacterium]
MTAEPVDPGRLDAFLRDGASFGAPGAEVERITTHAALILLVADRAYKMKRTVRYSFLDFSTLDQRKRALEAELRLNRRTAPTLYRRLVAITVDAAGQLALDGDGEPVEWVLEMNRFDQAALLDRIAERGALEAVSVDDLAREIAAFHREAEQRTDPRDQTSMADVIGGNAGDLRSLVGPVFDASQVREVNQASQATLERVQQLLEERRASGFVRHCHGDLHLGNIVLLDGTPVLFDCLEFDDKLATIDTFYDLAFLIMDLLHRNLGPLAHRLLNGYLDATSDDAGTALLPLFLSCRAAIRAKITGFAAGAQTRTEDRDAETSAARAYLDLALRLLQPPPPSLVAVGGLSGTGKSTLAHALAPQLGAAPGAVVLRTDVIRKAMFGVAATEPLRSEAYHEDISLRVYDIMISRARTLIESGHAVILDALFLDPSHRARAERIAVESEVPFEGFWLTASAATLRDRVAKRRADASDATVAVLEGQLTADPGHISWTQLDASGGASSVVQAARSVLVGRSVRQEHGSSAQPAVP